MTKSKGLSVVLDFISVETFQVFANKTSLF